MNHQRRRKWWTICCLGGLDFKTSGSSGCDPNLGVLFVTFSGANRDLHLGYQKVTWKKLVHAKAQEDFWWRGAKQCWQCIDVGFFQRRCHKLRIWRSWQDKRRSEFLAVELCLCLKFAEWCFFFKWHNRTLRQWNQSEWVLVNLHMFLSLSLVIFLTFTACPTATIQENQLIKVGVDFIDAPL